MYDNHNLTTPFPRSYWVIPGKLLAGAYPSSVDTDERKAMMYALADAGIQVVIDLTEPGEQNRNGIELYDFKDDF